MDLLIPVLICAGAALLSSSLVFFFVFPRLPGFSLVGHKIIGGLIFAPLQGLTTAIAFGTALWLATISSVITALGGGLSAVPMIYTVALGGTSLILFVANMVLIAAYKAMGIIKIEGKYGIAIGVATLMAAQIIACIIAAVFCIAMFAEGRTYSYIDTKGKVAFDKTFKDADSFVDGKARVTYITDSDTTNRYIDRTGKEVEAPKEGIPDRTNRLDDNPDLYEKQGSYSLNQNWIVLHELQMMPYSEGLAAARPLSKQTNWGFVDSNFNFVIPPDKFDDVRHFKDGLAAVCIDDSSSSPRRQWGYIDKTGKFVIKPQYLSAECFSDGLALVSIVDPKNESKILYGFIDKSGNFAIEPKFSYAKSFAEGLAPVVRR